jgi:hypothetical protein
MYKYATKLPNIPKKVKKGGGTQYAVAEGKKLAFKPFQKVL